MEKKNRKIVFGFILNIFHFFRNFFFFIPHGSCRYYPSCSSYAKEAFIELPLHRSLFKILIRLLKCNPFSKGGYDPLKK